jgi:putative ABC transport system ATP-binding protein
VTGALDSVSGTGVMELLHELNGNGTTIVIITHDREIAAGLPRQVAMRDGRIVSDSGEDRPYADEGRGAGHVRETVESEVA